MEVKFCGLDGPIGEVKWRCGMSELMLNNQMGMTEVIDSVTADEYIRLDQYEMLQLTVDHLKNQVDELKAWGKSLPCPDSCHNGGLYTDLGYGNFDVERCEWCGKRDDALSGKANNIPGLTEGRCACGYYGYISEGMCPDCFVVPSGGAG